MMDPVSEEARELERLRGLWLQLHQALTGNTRSAGNAAVVMEAARLRDEALGPAPAGEPCPVCAAPTPLHTPVCPLSANGGPYHIPVDWQAQPPRVSMNAAAHELAVCWHPGADCPDSAVALGSGVYLRCAPDLYPAGIVLKFAEMAAAMHLPPGTMF